MDILVVATQIAAIQDSYPDRHVNPPTVAEGVLLCGDGESVDRLLSQSGPEEAA